MWVLVFMDGVEELITFKAIAPTIASTMNTWSVAQFVRRRKPDIAALTATYV